MAVKRFDLVNDEAGSPKMEEREKGAYILATEYDKLRSEYQELVEKFHRRTDLGKRLVAILESDLTLLMGRGQKNLANQVLAEWDEEIRL